MTEKVSENIKNTKTTLLEIVRTSIQESEIPEVKTLDPGEKLELADEIVEAIMFRTRRYWPQKTAVIFRDSNAVLLQEALERAKDVEEPDIDLRDWIHEAECVLQNLQ